MLANQVCVFTDDEYPMSGTLKLISGVGKLYVSVFFGWPIEVQVGQQVEFS